MAIHSSILAWRIPWTEEPDGLQSMGSQSQKRLSARAHTHTHTHTHTGIVSYAEVVYIRQHLSTVEMIFEISFVGATLEIHSSIS